MPTADSIAAMAAAKAAAAKTKTSAPAVDTTTMQGVLQASGISAPIVKQIITPVQQPTTAQLANPGSVNTTTAQGIMLAGAASQQAVATQQSLSAAKASQAAVTQLTTNGVNSLTPEQAQILNIAQPSSIQSNSSSSSSSSSSTTAQSGSTSQTGTTSNDTKSTPTTSTNAVDNTSVSTGNASNAVKIATSNLFVFDETTVSIESMTDAIFEDIGGTELIDLTRSDLVYDVQTQTAPYQPIKNLSEVVDKYSPKSLATLQETTEQYLAAFPIDINKIVPLVPIGNNGDTSHIYVDWTGATNIDSIVIETVNVDTNNKEYIEVEILNYNSLYSDTI